LGEIGKSGSSRALAREVFQQEGRGKSLSEKNLHDFRQSDWHILSRLHSSAVP
jgi:hypothetical protein